MKHTHTPISRKLIAGILSGEASHEETRKFEEWQGKSEANEEYFKSLKEIWKRTETLSGYDLIDLDSARNRIRATLGIKPKSQSRVLYKFARAAAVLLLFIGLGWLSHYVYNKSTVADIVFVEVTTSYGEKQELILSDGSRVRINTGSILKYPSEFTGQKREVYLEGEAFFEIAYNSNAPFIVNTSDLSVKVIGTKFNVSSYPDDKMIETVLLEGCVQLDDNDNKYILKPNEKAHYSVEDRSMIINSVDALNYVSWTEGRLTFNDESFESISRKLERWYDIDIIISDQSIRKNRYSFTVDEDKTIEHVLSLLDIATPIDYSKEGRTITIK